MEIKIIVCLSDKERLKIKEQIDYIVLGTELQKMDAINNIYEFVDKQINEAYESGKRCS